MEDSEMSTELEAFEKRVGAPGKAAELLGVSYTGSYGAWKGGKRAIPRYITQSVRAHMRLSDAAFRSLAREAGVEVVRPGPHVRRMLRSETEDASRLRPDPGHE